MALAASAKALALGWSARAARRIGEMTAQPVLYRYPSQISPFFDYVYFSSVTGVAAAHGQGLAGSTVYFATQQSWRLDKLERLLLRQLGPAAWIDLPGGRGIASAAWA